LKQSYVLDTGVLLNLVRGKELGTRIDREFALTRSMRLHTVSIVTHGELKVLAERNDWGAEKRNALAVALDNLVTVNIESEALVEAYVQVDRACWSNSGGSRTLSQNDMWSAATALLSDLPLITTDKDFLALHERLITVHSIDAKGL
jgi:predicted nucleic acid-binding protein